MRPFPTSPSTRASEKSSCLRSRFRTPRQRDRNLQQTQSPRRGLPLRGDWVEVTAEPTTSWSRTVSRQDRSCAHFPFGKHAAPVVCRSFSQKSTARFFGSPEGSARLAAGCMRAWMHISITTNKSPAEDCLCGGFVFDIRNSCEIIEYETVGDPSKDELRGVSLCKKGQAKEEI